jgi:hypothetical protein
MVTCSRLVCGTYVDSGLQTASPARGQWISSFIYKIYVLMKPVDSNCVQTVDKNCCCVLARAIYLYSRLIEDQPFPNAVRPDV